MLGRPVLVDRLAVFALALFLLSVGFVWQNRSSESALAQDSPAQVEPPPPPKKLSGPVKISFDVQKVHKEPSSVFDTCGIPAPTDGAPAPWKSWIRFEGKRLQAVSSAPEVPAYAMRTPDGIALCVTNQTDGPADVRLSAKLLRGVYTIERVVLDPEDESAVLAVDRLPGAILENSSSIRTVGTIPARGTAIYRYVNRTQQALAAFRSAQQRIKELKSSRAQYNWLMVPFSECGSNIAVIARGIRPDNRYKVLKHVHRAILTTAHTQALCRNFTGQGRIKSDAGSGLADRLHSLDEALSELSIACLGLAPSAQVDPGNGITKVTVSFTNTGSQTINFVKIGAVGEGALKVSPEELATFGSVRPGETARATYSVKCGKPDELCRLAAHFGYLAGKSPVRLRLQPAI